jgi:hypothetical protein
MSGDVIQGLRRHVAPCFCDDCTSERVAAILAPECPACHGWRSQSVLVPATDAAGLPTLRYEQRSCTVCHDATHAPEPRR